jgi:hypothetical protein
LLNEKIFAIDDVNLEGGVLFLAREGHHSLSIQRGLLSMLLVARGKLFSVANAIVVQFLAIPPCVLLDRGDGPNKVVSTHGGANMRPSKERGALDGPSAFRHRARYVMIKKHAMITTPFELTSPVPHAPNQSFV